MAGTDATGTAAPAPGAGRLQERSIGLPQVLFQAITHMGPAAAVAFSLGVGFTFAGAAMPLAVLVTLVCVLLIANSVGQLARHIPSAGGLYAYAAQALGRHGGFMVGWCTALLEVVVAPAISMVLGNVLHDAFAGLVDTPWWLWATLCLGLVTFLNYRGVRMATNVGIVLGVFELLVFLALAVHMIVARGSANTLEVFNPAHALQGGLAGVFKGVVFSILAFQGFETAAPLGEEARAPRRSIALATLLSGLIIGVFYFVCAYGAVIGWGFDRMASYATNPDPWHQLAVTFWGAGWVVVVLALVNSAVGNANGGTACATRVIYAMGRVGALPRALGRTHPRHRTPHIAILTQLGLGLLLMYALGGPLGPSNGFQVMATVLTVLVILVYMATCVGTFAFYLRQRRSEFNPLLHAVFPLAGGLVLLAPLYYQFVPPPAQPMQTANWVALAWVVAGVAVMAVLGARRPAALRRAAEVFAQGEVEA